jgi:hypothetical protein
VVWLVKLWWWLARFLPVFGRGRANSSQAPRLGSTGARPEVFAVVHVSEDPEDLSPGTLYAVGENGNLWHITFLCPCGCLAVIALNLLPDDDPCWTLRLSIDGPSLSPSVWRTTGCRSHFILCRGQVVWCTADGREGRDDLG